MVAAEYKHILLGLIFLKYISDAFEELHEKIEVWRKEYNSFRPHSSLGDLTLNEHLDQQTVPGNSVLLAGQ
jgi:type I restriction-modification system DNA methylase subunit